MTNVSILIVSYNTAALTLECLRSVYRETRELAFEVVLVDNASVDDSAAAVAREFPQVRLIQLTENTGFARANNVAARVASGEYLLLLNPDTLVLRGAIQTLLEFAASRPHAQIYGGRTLFADGSLNLASCWGRATLWSMFCRASGLAVLFAGSEVFNPEGYGSWARDSVREVAIVTGCFLLIRKELWSQLGGFDESFFMYGEEADLCLRARRVGARPTICPDAQIVHHGGQSDKIWTTSKVRLFRAKAQLCRKHWTPRAARLGIAMLDLWALTRVVAYAMIGAVRMGGRESYREWRAIWRKRTAWHVPSSTTEPLAAAGLCKRD